MTGPRIYAEDDEQVVKSWVDLPRSTHSRTFPYFDCLPYQVEPYNDRIRHLQHIVSKIIVAASAGDSISGNLLFWCKELDSWSSLCFDMPPQIRAHLIHIFYTISLSLTIDRKTADTCTDILCSLAEKRPEEIQPLLTLDYKPLLDLMIAQSGIDPVQRPGGSVIMVSVNSLIRVASTLRPFFDSQSAIPGILNRLLPLFVPYAPTSSYVIALITSLMPTSKQVSSSSSPSLEWLPSLFYIASLDNRQYQFDFGFVNLMSQLARDSLCDPSIPIQGDNGIFTPQQASSLFSIFLKLLEVRVGGKASGSPYTGKVGSPPSYLVYSSSDVGANHTSSGDRNSRSLNRKEARPPQAIARLIIWSLTPTMQQLDETNTNTELSASIIAKLEALIQSVETFFHPSNHGPWTNQLSYLIYYLCHFFVLRWNKEHNGESPEIPKSRRLTDPIRTRFVNALRGAIFMGVYSKNSTASDLMQSSLKYLAYLEPNVILPLVLKQIYPSLQGFEETHRTATSLTNLVELSRIISQSPKYRNHITALLGLALPGIDPNDLGKTYRSLAFMQTVYLNVPIVDLSNGHGTSLAIDWVSGQVAQMEEEDQPISDAQAEMYMGAAAAAEYSNNDNNLDSVLESSTGGFEEFLSAFLEQVMSLLDNLPERKTAARAAPEAQVVHLLPSVFEALFGSLSPQLFSLAVSKIISFISDRVIHQADDVVARICRAMTKANPELVLPKLLPPLIAAIYEEVNENGAGSDATNEVLPKDRALVWNLAILSNSVADTGSALLKFKSQLCDVALFVRTKCQGLAAAYGANLIHNILTSLISTYPMDYYIDKAEKVLANELGLEQWGQIVDPKKLDIRWHVPSSREIEFAIEMFKSHTEQSIERLNVLLSVPSSGKKWSDDLKKEVLFLRFIMSGVSLLLNRDYASVQNISSDIGVNGDYVYGDEQNKLFEALPEDQNHDNELQEGQRFRRYPSNYYLSDKDPKYLDLLHRLRGKVGEILHQTHIVLTTKFPDKVTCFEELSAAIRIWLIDIGYERSAKPLDRLCHQYVKDIAPFKIPGLRKNYPRPLLVKRAQIYHYQRLQYNAFPRAMSEMDKVLIQDLLNSSVSRYTAIRKVAQNSLEGCFKNLSKCRLFCARWYIEATSKALQDKDYDGAKGGMHAMNFKLLQGALMRQLDLLPKYVEILSQAAAADKRSINEIGQYLSVNLYRNFHVSYIFSDLSLSRFEPFIKALMLKNSKIEYDLTKVEEKRRLRLNKFPNQHENFARALCQSAQKASWRAELYNVSILAKSENYNVEHTPHDFVVQLFLQGTLKPDPHLRYAYSAGLTQFIEFIALRTICKDDAHQYFSCDLPEQGTIIRECKGDNNKTFSQKVIEEFATTMDNDDNIKEYWDDQEEAGWLIWPKQIRLIDGKKSRDLPTPSEKDGRALELIKRSIDKKWLNKYLSYMAEEVTEEYEGVINVSTINLLDMIFRLHFYGYTSLEWDDIVEQVDNILGDGSSKDHQRATAEVIAALMGGPLRSANSNKGQESQILGLIIKVLTKVYNDMLTPETLGYWRRIISYGVPFNDYRRLAPVMELLTSFRIDRASNSVFRESSKLRLLQSSLVHLPWYSSVCDPIIDECVGNLDHGYKGVRDALGETLATISKTRNDKTFGSVQEFIEENSKDCDYQSRAYVPSKGESDKFEGIVDRMEEWFKERSIGKEGEKEEDEQQEEINKKGNPGRSFEYASKTLLIWLSEWLTHPQGPKVVHLVVGKNGSARLLSIVLKMLDVRGDADLSALCLEMFLNLGNTVSCSPGLVQELTGAIIKIASQQQQETSWHQRIGILTFAQIIFFRNLFLINRQERRSMFNAIVEMLIGDNQFEVRAHAATTLAGMIRCSNHKEQIYLVEWLSRKFIKELQESGEGKKKNNSGVQTQSYNQSKRHGAVLGLGALVEAFPYQSPPPKWIPSILTRLATMSSNERGIVGESVRTILNQFKKTRQDTWKIDVRIFTIDQLEDLEGILGHNYYA